MNNNNKNLGEFITAFGTGFAIGFISGALVTAIIDYYDEKKKNLQQSIADSLRSQNLDKVETPVAKVTIGKDSVTRKFDLKAFMESQQYKDSPKVYDAFIKESTTAGRITITLR